jgi:hypothetical protein
MEEMRPIMLLNCRFSLASDMKELRIPETGSIEASLLPLKNLGHNLNSRSLV